METLVLIFTGAFLLLIPPLATAALLRWVVDSFKSRLQVDEVESRRL